MKDVKATSAKDVKAMSAQELLAKAGVANMLAGRKLTLIIHKSRLWFRRIGMVAVVLFAGFCGRVAMAGESGESGGTITYIHGVGPSIANESSRVLIYSDSDGWLASDGDFLLDLNVWRTEVAPAWIGLSVRRFSRAMPELRMTPLNRHSDKQQLLNFIYRGDSEP